MRYLFLLIFFTANLSYADSLSIEDAYRLALTYDAQYAAVRANNLGQHDEIDLAKSAFFPKAGLSISQGRSYQDAVISNGPSKGRAYTTQNINLSVRQPIYNKAVMATYDSAKANAESSDAALEKEKSNLFLRLTSAYLSVLSAIDNIHHSKQLKKAAEMQLESANSRYKNGQGTITEISESLAQKDNAIAEELIWLNAYEDSKHRLEMIIGQYPTKLYLLDAAKIKKSIPDPQTLDEWISLGLDNSFEIKAAAKQVEVATYDLEKRKAGHYPTVDLVLSQIKSESDTNFSVGNTYDTTSLTVQGNLPIYSGGFVVASVEQGEHRLQEARNKLDQKTREVTSNIRKFYSACNNGIAQMTAKENLVKAGEGALNGTIKGFENGFRTNVEVLNAQEKLYKSEVDLSTVRYDFVTNLISLLDATGTLGQNTVDDLNAWFVIEEQK